MNTPRASIFDGDDIDVTAFAPKPGPDRCGSGADRSVDAAGA